MQFKKIIIALLTYIGTGGLFIIYGILAIFFFMGGISRVFNSKNFF
jgi:hypothetical protein